MEFPEGLDPFPYIAKKFKALSEPVRLRILWMLRQSGTQHVNELASELDVSQPTISKHLAILTSEGFLQLERRGSYRYYSLKDDSVAAICDLICQQLERENAALSHSIEMLHASTSNDNTREDDAPS